MLQIALFAQNHRQPRMTCMRGLLGARLLVKSTWKWLVMRPTAPENFDSDATTDRLDSTPLGRPTSTWVDLLDLTRRSRYCIARHHAVTLCVCVSTEPLNVTHQLHAALVSAPKVMHCIQCSLDRLSCGTVATVLRLERLTLVVQRCVSIENCTNANTTNNERI